MPVTFTVLALATPGDSTQIGSVLFFGAISAFKQNVPWFLGFSTLVILLIWLINKMIIFHKGIERGLSCRTKIPRGSQTITDI